MKLSIRLDNNPLVFVEEVEEYSVPSLEQAKQVIQPNEFLIVSHHDTNNRDINGNYIKDKKYSYEEVLALDNL